MQDMIFVIDNYDSFTYNLVQYLGELGAESVVYRNDAVSLEKVKTLDFTHIIISPGPGTPDDSGISKTIISEFAGKAPILGVCLGHQAIGEVFGAKVVKTPNLMHGKTSKITYETDDALFKEVENPFTATRYHSLIIDNDSVKGTPLKITAKTSDNVIMAIKHEKYQDVFGIQFHPESILTSQGRQILSNFLSISV